jgi:hypothetical protein
VVLTDPVPEPLPQIAQHVSFTDDADRRRLLATASDRFRPDMAFAPHPGTT